MSRLDDPRVLSSLVARLQRFTPELAPRWGTLAPGEVLCHLGDAAQSALTRGDGGPGPTRALAKWLGLYAPLHWPKGAQTPAHVDPRVGGTRPGDFEQDRRRAIDGLHRLAQAAPEDFKASHARFGRMAARDWKRWAFRHTDHHLRQFGL